MAAIDGTKIFNKFFGINYGAAYAYFKTQADEDYFFNTYLPERFPGQNSVWADRAVFLAGLRIDAGGVIKVTAGYNYPDTAANRYKSDFIDPVTYAGNVLMGATNAPYNLFCAACHTDYLDGSASSQPAGGVGIYSKAFRHTINRGATGGETMAVRAAGNNLLCVSCHFAHGVDSSFMSLANAKLVDDPTSGFTGDNDVNQSSALKRYINMSVCWSCHANSSATTLKNTQWYWNSYDTMKQGNW
jgi:hypothetical protein